MDTLLLDQAQWDLVLDINNNLAVATAPYAIAQDVASACRTVAGEVWYDTSLGVRYFDILGRAPNLSTVRQQLEAQARLVPGVKEARCVLATLQDRTLTGQIQVTDNSGTASLINY